MAAPTRQNTHKQSTFEYDDEDDDDDDEDDDDDDDNYSQLDDIISR